MNVPLNKNGIKEFDSYDEKMENVKTFELTEKEYSELRKKRGLFQKFDEKLGIMIDVCEEERIDNEKLADALQIANNLLKKQENKVVVQAIKKVINSLECAIESGTFWEIDIYVE